jgi:hypothetical protein
VVDVLKCSSETRLHKAPSSLVFVFFLGPANFCVLVKIKLFDNVCEGEWRQLLNSDDSDVLLAQLLSFCNEIVVNLTSAQDNFSYIVWYD